jgi:hypothetical protein
MLHKISISAERNKYSVRLNSGTAALAISGTATPENILRMKGIYISLKGFHAFMIDTYLL